MVADSMTHHFIAIGNALSCVTVDAHNRVTETPPHLLDWIGYPWLALRQHIERLGGTYGEIDGDDLLALRDFKRIVRDA